MRRALIALLVATLTYSGVAFATTPLPAPTGFVNDYAGVLSTETKQNLEAELVAFNASTTNEIAVALVPSLDGDYIEHYAVTLFQNWGIGTKKNDNGVLLLLAINDRKLRIEVGYELEGALPDSVAASIISDMTPLLKAGDYDGAVTLGVQSIEEATRGEYVGSGAQGSGIDTEAVFGIIFGAVVLLQWLIAIMARTKSIWAGGVAGVLLGVVLSSIFGWWLVAGLVVTAILSGLGVLLDYAVSGAYHAAKSSGVQPPWWSGGAGGFGGGSSGGGFGGFGGGSSGGGGASGGW